LLPQINKLNNGITKTIKKKEKRKRRIKEKQSVLLLYMCRRK